MQTLLAITHYFADDPKASWHSTDGSRRATRTERVQAVIQAWRGHFQPPTTIDIASKSFQPGTGAGDHVDIALVTVPGCSLIDDAFCRRWDVHRIEHQPSNPRMLGFHGHELFAKHAHAYDLFCWSEDDLRPSGPDFLSKLRHFTHLHGHERVLLPNRYEWNPAAPTLKTYIDGDLRTGLVDPLIALHPDREVLEGEAFGRPLLFRRARNPHAGFFALTQAQLAHWMRQPHWLDRDVSFISPLESAATLGLVKTFAVYKSWGSSMGHLEIEHLDGRFATMQLPRREGGLGG